MKPSMIEQTKLLANALDRASTACFTVGIATPVAYLHAQRELGPALASYLSTQKAATVAAVPERIAA